METHVGDVVFLEDGRRSMSMDWAHNDWVICLCYAPSSRDFGIILLTLYEHLSTIYSDDH